MSEQTSEQTSEQIGIFNTTNGQCDAHLNIRGEDFPCDLARDHNGWAHSSAAAEAIWSPRPDAPTPTPAETCTATNFFDLCGYPREHGGPHRYETPTPAGDDAIAAAARDLATAVERVGEFRRYWPREMRSEARAVESALDRLATLGIGADR